MNEIVVRVTDSINKLLESSWELLYLTKHKLVDIPNLLNRLLEQDSPKNKWTRLFCRQLKRLMDSNDLLLDLFWMELHDDILCALNEPNLERNMDSEWSSFLRRMHFEEKLEQRELHDQQIVGKRKSLSELFYKRREFFEGYLQKCISFHSKMQIQGLVENLDDLCRVYGLEELSLSFDNREHLRKKLKSIEIPLDCSNKSINSLNPHFSSNDNSLESMNTNLSTYLPSKQVHINISNDSEIIENVLGSSRWIVILGDPGSAKTTLLRWLTRVFVEAADRSADKVSLQGCDHLPLRIPILIRIGEFASWLNQHQTKTLLDYIGEHTWFSERYCDDEGSSVLKELIHYGHALILLDGLDEIPEIARRGEIIDHVRQFIDEYVRAPDFVSAFDDTILFHYQRIIETQPPSKSGGNQIVITSRLVGYQFRPLDGPLIKHYSLLLMSHQEANEFVKKWMRQVNEGICDVLLNEGIELDKEKMKTSLNRVHNVGQVFLKNSSESLKSNPSLLALICTFFISQSTVEIHFKSRIEVYSLAVRAAFSAWRRQNSSILESDLTNFLLDLAIHLHLQSPSGLIDAFDIENLCCVTFKQQKNSTNRAKQREYAKQMISFLESNIAIVAERGLQTFGFLHLSFQEYFVAQALLRDSSIEDIAKRILSFTINPRFRESLLLALGWISWKWSVDDYDKFCQFLFTQMEKQSILFGVLLFFEATNDIHRLPSNSVIYIALNNLLNHSSAIIRRIYMIASLSKLPNSIIIEWMNLYLKDDKRLLKFCQSFPMIGKNLHGLPPKDRKPISSTIYQQLWSLHNRSSSIEYLVDKTLQKTLLSVEVVDQIFNKDLALHFASPDIGASNTHPLILSVIVALCGGIYLEYEVNTIKVDFSPKYTHRECSILVSIIEYFENNEESHLVKIQKLINQYESDLQQTLPADTSVRTIDTFIALICLQGLSQPLIYQKYNGFRALPLALERFKHIWFYLRELRQPLRTNSYTSSETNVHRMTIDSIIEMFYWPRNQSKQGSKSFPIICEIAWKMLGFWNLENWNSFQIFGRNKIGRCIQCHPQITRFIRQEKFDQLVENIYSREMIQNEPLFLLMFLPQSLHLLYYCTIISPTDKTDSLPLVVFLAECLTHFEDIDKERPILFLALPKWQSLFKTHMLENYAMGHFQEEYLNKQIIRIYVDDFFQTLEDPQLFDTVRIMQPKDWELLITVERQRISVLKSGVQDQEKDRQLFAASISLARLFQAKYCSHKYQAVKEISLSTLENNEVHLAIMNISDSVLRIIAWSIILDMKDPLIFDIEQRDQLRSEMISPLQSLLPCLPLLTSTFLFIRCHTIRQIFLEPFQSMTNVIRNKFNDPSMNRQCREEEAAFIALRQLKNPDLSDYLSEFAKRKENLSDLLLFNSTAFYRYFANTTSFDSSNHAVLASMYLTELAFDAQIINIYTDVTQKNKILPLTVLKQLWHDSSNYKKIMTFHVALWITNYLPLSNQVEIQQIIEDLTSCSMIEKKALPVIEKWLDYRMNQDLRFFAHYVTLHLIAEGSDIPDLVKTVEEILLTDRQFRLKSVVERLFISPLVDLTILHQVLVILHCNDRYFSKIHVWIDYQDTLELILNLERERITNDVHHPSKIPTKSFLLLIKGFSVHLQVYLVEHLREFVNTHSEIEQKVKEEYVAVVIKWVIEDSLRLKTTEKFSEELHDYILELLHDQQFPLVQKAICKSIYLVSFGYHEDEENVFYQEKTIINLERVVCSWNTYSEDLVAVCLLAYRCSLLNLRRLERSRNVSDETKNILCNFSESSFSEIISIRAKICSIFTECSGTNVTEISSYLTNKWKMMLRDKYKLLVELTLGEEFSETSVVVENERKAAELLEMHFAELIDMFVTDLHNYLCSSGGSNDLVDSMPNYAKIATVLIERKPNEFCNAVRNSSYGEKEFKNKLFLHYGRNPKNRNAVINIYTVFSIVTIELLDMLEQNDDDDEDNISVHINGKYLTQVSDRSVTDKMFHLIDSTTSKKQLNNYLDILQSLAQVGAVSLLEVHQKMVLLKNIPYDYDVRILNKERHVLRLLTNVSCFEVVSPKFEDVSIESDIEEEFEKENW